ncbi:MAG: ChrR family anti-sigma-E factor [Paracoccaceae bacterium]
MTIRHHLTDPLLIAYAAGSLPEAFSLVVATHVSLCDECRARLASFDAVGGAVMSLDSVAMSQGSLDAVMARLSAPEVKAPVQRHGIFPVPLQDYVGGDLSAVNWRNLGMGVRQAILPTAKSASARLLYIPAGQAVPDHGHRGTELTLVLQGAFNDATARFGPGDVEIANQDLKHTPTAEPGVPCICLAATDAPLRFTSLIPRLLQPIFRI